mmetsp:Transcript_52404/g.93541  ORF Transcript_52404/g.93541 Transcript_52404/m.93541 type:complete len:127 (-) Transcript_52404:610-990(-)
MVKDTLMPIEIVLGDTHREMNGLAMSTRNKYLSPEQIEKAAVIFAALSKAQDLCSSGMHSVKLIIDAVTAQLQTVEGMAVLYVVVSTLQDMQDLDLEDEVPEEGAILSCAVRYGPARLIDNVDLHR